MKKTLIAIAALVVVIGGMTAMWKHSAAVDRALFATADCVVNVAHEQGYPGNPYSKEAWDLFASSCEK